MTEIEQLKLALIETQINLVQTQAALLQYQRQELLNQVKPEASDDQPV